MAGQKFQYDESGATFYYFVLSFFALLLVPVTYFWWPRKKQSEDEKESEFCQCPGCNKKRLLVDGRKSLKLLKELMIKAALISCWCFVLFLVYQISHFEYEHSTFDPYDILGVPVGSSEAVVKKAYRRLSLILHPDKETGNEKGFMQLTKAYQALTDENARRNWEKYGNPDGPGAMSFGIALPSWIVEKENSVWVLGLYALVFMVALPTAVGTWWYRSIRYSGDKVLLDTTRMYYYFFHKTPSMPLKRVIMILGASLEFEKRYNSEIVERESDNFEVPKLINAMGNVGEKNRERPLYYKYSLKARALIYAHLSRVPLNPETLDIDRLAVVRKCSVLIQEMISCISQLILLAYAQRVPRLLNIETLENCMKLCPMIVQALWDYKSPLLQLPHVQEEHLKHFVIRKRYIRNIQQFARLSDSDKRAILKFLKEESYNDVLKVVGKMPHIEAQVRCEVIDDDVSTVYTAGAIVTVTVVLKRRNLGDVYNGNETQPSEQPEAECKDAAEQKQENAAANSTPKKAPVAVNKSIWQKKSQKGCKKGGGGSSSKKNQKKQAKVLLKKHQQQPTEQKKKEEEEESATAGGDGGEHVETDEKHGEEKGQQSSINADEKGLSDVDKAANHDKDNDDDDGGSVTDNDDNWEKVQEQITKRERSLEGKGKISHTVHSPYFSENKQEYWWVYVSDRKSRTLLTAPVHVTHLVDYEEIQMRFTAPRWPGLYTFTVCVRSDSYLGFDQMIDMKLDVKEAPAVPVDHPQWDISDEENEEKDEGPEDDVSEFTSDEDIEN